MNFCTRGVHIAVTVICFQFELVSAQAGKSLAMTQVLTHLSYFQILEILDRLCTLKSKRGRPPIMSCAELQEDSVTPSGYNAASVIFEPTAL